jgi:transposase
VRFALEATGVYSLDLARELVVAGAQVMIINPRAWHNFAEALRNRRTDDPVDAATLRQAGAVLALRPWQPPSGRHFAVRALVRHAAMHVKSLTAARNRRPAARATEVTPQAVIDSREREIAHLESEIDTRRADALTLIAQDPELVRKLDLAKTILGVGDVIAVMIVAELGLRPQDMRARQWVALCGLDVREERSGTSVDHAPHISKRGKNRLRAVLYMAAQSLARDQGRVVKWCERLQGNGKEAQEAIVAVMRKLVHGLHAMWRTNTAFDAKRLFGI